MGCRMLHLRVQARTLTYVCLCVCYLPCTCLCVCPQELGTLLNVAPHKAEALAADMIGEGRLSGRIDQVRGDTDSASYHPVLTSSCVISSCVWVDRQVVTRV